MGKVFIGPKLRQLRQSHAHTQRQLADMLGVSPAYVNLLENNQRSLSIKLLVSLSDIYKIDLKSFAFSNEVEKIGALRQLMRDPVFTAERPDLQELRAAIDHAPRLVEQLQNLHQNYQRLAEHVHLTTQFDDATQAQAAQIDREIERFFKSQGSDLALLNSLARRIRTRIGGPQDDLYALLKSYLHREHSIVVQVRPVSEMPSSLRNFDEIDKTVHLSEVLDQPNRNFELAYAIAYVEVRQNVSELIAHVQEATAALRAHLEIELLNYVASAILMPLDTTLSIAKETGYDFERIASSLGVSFEQVCYRLTTLKALDNDAVPFFFIQIDRAGNVIKRFSGNDMNLARHGGACAVWNAHSAFQMPGALMKQFVELPDGSRYFTLARTAERPALAGDCLDRQIVVALGCQVEFADQLIYSRGYALADETNFAPIGMNCHICPRQKCAQRAQAPLTVELELNAHTLGLNRYES